MAAPATPRVGRQGRQSRAIEQLLDQRDELEAHRQEALAFADLCWPLLSRLEVVAREVGPLALQTVLTLEVALARYERRHLDPDPDVAAAVA